MSSAVKDSGSTLSAVVGNSGPTLSDGVNDSALPVRDRIQALDVLRGVAVGGILLANVLAFFGLSFLPADRIAAMPTAAADRVATFFEHAFIDAKFYSVFSLLFGIGFGVQLERGGDAALPRFRRRLRILLGIGAIHAFLIWAGDILMLYALLGFTMPWFARKSNRELLRWTVVLLAVPTVLYLVALATWMMVGSGAAQTSTGRAVPANILPYFAAIGTGGFKDALVGNLVFLAGRWADLFITVRFPKVLGMFVLGLWAVRTGIALSPSDHRATLARWRLLGLGIGLPMNLIAAWSFEHWSYLPPSVGGLLGVVMQAVGVPMLAIGYATTIALMVVDGRRFIKAFAPVGRMALTNYLMHSIICVTLSYGFGFGLWWRIGAAQAMAIAVVIIAVQIPLSALWLSRYRFGPVEWVWRRLTYGRPV
ncbi:MAG TPA: DUF418 domain-containing protein [Gemmatimonadaceae bacterium]|nr:DUF418 domain-containing protein [Gemmatimonadaceae bacterium]